MRCEQLNENQRSSLDFILVRSPCGTHSVIRIFIQTKQHANQLKRINVNLVNLRIWLHKIVCWYWCVRIDLSVAQSVTVNQTTCYQKFNLHTHFTELNLAIPFFFVDFVFVFVRLSQNKTVLCVATPVNVYVECWRSCVQSVFGIILNDFNWVYLSVSQKYTFILNRVAWRCEI